MNPIREQFKKALRANANIFDLELRVSVKRKIQSIDEDVIEEWLHDMGEAGENPAKWEEIRKSIVDSLGPGELDIHI